MFEKILPIQFGGKFCPSLKAQSYHVFCFVILILFTIISNFFFIFLVEKEQLVVLGIYILTSTVFNDVKSANIINRQRIEEKVCSALRLGQNIDPP